MDILSSTTTVSKFGESYLSGSIEMLGIFIALVMIVLVIKKLIG